MSDVILVVLGRPEAAARLLRAAECLAQLTGAARVNVLAVRTPPEYAAVAAEANLSAGLLNDLAAAEDERVAALEAAFTRWTAGLAEAPFTARWSSVEGPANRVVGDEGRRADSVVAARPASGDDDATRRAFRAALFRTERPVLVVPPGEAAAPFGRRVAIAWRDDARAAKAVLPALRCLGGAEQVHVLAGVREGAARPALPRILVDHGVAAELHVLPIGRGPFGQDLLNKAHELGADLLVMGAYAHSPLREALLGGVTRHVLAYADLPVLMRY
jgi:nucleotide-binding universal stress UspA family protein